MRILQISDLHFGAHNSHLKQNLLDLTRETLKPDVILATGDLADRPTKKNLGEALEFLKELEGLCSSGLTDVAYPKLIVIPGNHDVNYLLGTAWPHRATYDKHFGKIDSSCYFASQRVWIYGFDSARHRASGTYRGPTTGAIGKIRREQIVDFQHEFTKLLGKHGEAFESAFKIVALHHHPLPVKESTKLERWLLLDNAGTLLAVALQRKIDLILHGHEHEQARSTFWSTFGGSSASVQVVSAGACLAEAALNHVNLIVIREDGSATVEAYRARKGTEAFDEQPDIYSVRDPSQAREKNLQDAIKASGFVFHEVASTSILNEDGDCRHFVQCDGLEIKDPARARDRLTRVVLPITRGYVEPHFIRVKAKDGNELAGMRLTNKTATGGDLHFGRSFRLGESLSFEYEWWSLNAFAMDERQYSKKYIEERNTELAFFNVIHPIKSLNVIVKFPDNFGGSQTFGLRNLVVRVRKLEGDLQSPGESAKTLVQDLRDRQALKYIDSLNVASLRVEHPVVGHAYGISWRVPPFPLAPTGVPDQQGAEQIRRILREIEKHKQPNKVWRRSMKALLVTVAERFRAELMPEWHGDCELSLMVFKDPTRKLEDVASIQIKAGWSEMNLHNYGVSLDYGAGVAGKAYKTNHNRLWVKISPEQRKSPDYYLNLSGSPNHAVLLSMPLQNPVDERFVYAVINCGSASDQCPLRLFGQSAFSNPRMILKRGSVSNTR